MASCPVTVELIPAFCILFPKGLVCFGLYGMDDKDKVVCGATTTYSTGTLYLSYRKHFVEHLLWAIHPATSEHWFMVCVCVCVCVCVRVSWVSWVSWVSCARVTFFFK